MLDQMMHTLASNLPAVLFGLVIWAVFPALREIAKVFKRSL